MPDQTDLSANRYLSGDDVLRAVLDALNSQLRVSVTGLHDVTIDNASIQVNESGVGDPTDPVVTNPALSASSVALLKGVLTILEALQVAQPLPTGAATEATLAAIKLLLPAALGAGGGIKVDGSGTALPISGAVTGPLTDTQLRASAVPVSGSVSVSSLPAVSGAVTANAGTNLNTSLLALEAGGNLAAIKTDVDKIPSQGQAVMASSTPVAIASNQSAVPVTDSNSAALTTGGQGNKVVVTAATPLQLTAAACKLLILTARNGNTKQIAYGFSNTVRATVGSEVGATLQPGVSVPLPTSDVSNIWIDAAVNGEGVSYTYLN